MICDSDNHCPEDIENHRQINTFDDRGAMAMLVGHQRMLNESRALDKYPADTVAAFHCTCYYGQLSPAVIN